MALIIAVWFISAIAAMILLANKKTEVIGLLINSLGPISFFGTAMKDGFYFLAFSCAVCGTIYNLTFLFRIDKKKDENN